MTEAAAELPAPLSDPLPSPSFTERWLRRRSKTLLLLAAGFAFAISWLVAIALNVPVQPGFDGSLLTQQGIFSALFAVVISVAINAAILRAVLGRTMWLEIGFAIASGLLAFSARGGSMVDILQYHGAGVYIVLILETLLLYAALAGVWRWLRPEPTVDEAESAGDMQAKLTALAVTAVVMVVAMHLLCQSASKKQAIAAVALSAFAGATVAFSFLGEMSVEPYLLAPAAVAVAGYVLATTGGSSPLGQPTQVLAFPLPLQYAGAGVAGALLGYWMGLGWKQENERDE